MDLDVELAKLVDMGFDPAAATAALAVYGTAEGVVLSQSCGEGGVEADGPLVQAKRAGNVEAKLGEAATAFAVDGRAAALKLLGSDRASKVRAAVSQDVWGFVARCVEAARNDAEKALDKLVALGFLRHDAANALQEAGGDVSLAEALLVSKLEVDQALTRQRG